MSERRRGRGRGGGEGGLQLTPEPPPPLNTASTSAEAGKQPAAYRYTRTHAAAYILHVIIGVPDEMNALGDRMTAQFVYGRYVND